MCRDQKQTGEKLSRLRTIASADLDGGGDPLADGNKLAQYTYFGAATVVKVEHPAVDGGLNLTYGTGGTYGGFDRFGRVVDQKWEIKGANPANVKERYKYGYDGASNRRWRKVGREMSSPPSGKDEWYGDYDGLHRLIHAERGDLTGTPHAN